MICIGSISVDDFCSENTCRDSMCEKHCESQYHDHCSENGCSKQTNGALSTKCNLHEESHSEVVEIQYYEFINDNIKFFFKTKGFKRETQRNALARVLTGRFNEKKKTSCWIYVPAFLFGLFCFILNVVIIILSPREKNALLLNYTVQIMIMDMMLMDVTKKQRNMFLID